MRDGTVWSQRKPVFDWLVWAQTGDRMFATFSFAVAALVLAADAPSPGTATPRIFLHDPSALLRKKLHWRSDRKAEPAVTRLLDNADEALRSKPISIVDKEVVPPSGDKHDYLSLAPYAWPDPRKPNGLPYLIRDGEVNPERDRIPDHRSLARLCDLVETLGLGYFFTDDDKYAAHAARLLHAFFVDRETRMNPNLRFAQGVRGKEDGRAAGIIDGACIPRMIDGVGLLAPSKAWTAADRQAIDRWFSDYLAWLRESDLGRKEGRAGNNHGTWYDVQVASLQLATGKHEDAVETLSFARKRRIGRQIDPDGRQGEEMRRTRPWHYAAYNLEAMALLANLGDRAGVDLWRYQTADRRSIRQAFAWLLPFALGAKPWAEHDLGGMKPDELLPALREAASSLKDAELAAVVAKLGPQRVDRAWLFAE